MVLTRDDLSAIEASLGPEKAAPIISAFEKLEREQKFEIKKDLLMELATKADLAVLKVDLAEVKAALQAEIAELRVDFAGLKSEIKGEMKRQETLIKVLIGLVIVAMGFFSPTGTELIKLLK